MRLKKLYEAPETEVLEFSCENFICTSIENGSISQMNEQTLEW